MKTRIYAEPAVKGLLKFNIYTTWTKMWFLGQVGNTDE